MKKSMKITEMIGAANERDNLIAMVEHARELAKIVQEDTKENKFLFTLSSIEALQRIVNLNPPANSTASNVED